MSVAVKEALHLLKNGAQVWPAIAVLEAALTEPQPPAQDHAEADPQLCTFYGVKEFPALVAAMERHIERLQAELPKDSQPAFTRVREG